jgi:predicted amino acid-binding ACT domain protein
MKKRMPVPSTNVIESRILTLRGQKVILDADLAAIYGVTTKRLNEQVKRNARRFPSDFVFQLTWDEYTSLRSSLIASGEGVAMNRSQIATGSDRHRDPRFLPYAFTENGAIMAANILNSEQAVRMSVFVVRAFVRMRELLSGSKELAAELKKLEATLTARLDIHESAIVDVLKRIMQLLDPPPGPPVQEKSMGFHTTMKRPSRRRG